MRSIVIGTLLAASLTFTGTAPILAAAPKSQGKKCTCVQKDSHGSCVKKTCLDVVVTGKHKEKELFPRLPGQKGYQPPH